MDPFISAEIYQTESIQTKDIKQVNILNFKPHDIISLLFTLSIFYYHIC